MFLRASQPELFNAHVSRENLKEQKSFFIKFAPQVSLLLFLLICIIIPTLLMFIGYLFPSKDNNGSKIIGKINYFKRLIFSFFIVILYTLFIYIILNKFNYSVIEIIEKSQNIDKTLLLENIDKYTKNTLFNTPTLLFISIVIFIAFTISEKYFNIKANADNQLINKISPYLFIAYIIIYSLFFIWFTCIKWPKFDQNNKTFDIYCFWLYVPILLTLFIYFYISRIIIPKSTEFPEISKPLIYLLFLYGVLGLIWKKYIHLALNPNISINKKVILMESILLKLHIRNNTTKKIETLYNKKLIINMLLIIISIISLIKASDEFISNIKFTINYLWASIFFASNILILFIIPLLLNIFDYDKKTPMSFLIQKSIIRDKIAKKDD